MSHLVLHRYTIMYVCIYTEVCLLWIMHCPWLNDSLPNHFLGIHFFLECTHSFPISLSIIFTYSYIFTYLFALNQRLIVSTFSYNHSLPLNYIAHFFSFILELILTDSFSPLHYFSLILSNTYLYSLATTHPLKSLIHSIFLSNILFHKYLHSNRAC